MSDSAVIGLIVIVVVMVIFISFLKSLANKAELKLEVKKKRLQIVKNYWDYIDSAYTENWLFDFNKAEVIPRDSSSGNITEAIIETENYRDSNSMYGSKQTGKSSYFNKEWTQFMDSKL
jgi:hypothetical protein